ncbi:MAG: hypothetical protein KJI69_01210 [Patescibacteria group bacterium]|nr:hypothetical protein [Patescibacteria group bacterium]
MIERKIVIILGLIILILIIGFVVLEQEKEEGSGISLEEKQLIEAWITENDLNRYGDIKDTVYSGGTPLFDGRTGQSTDRYEYILRRYSDRPWNK